MLEKIKETFTSIGPIALIVLLLNWTITPLGDGMTLTFILSAIFTIVGLALFLLGADIGIIPMGEKAGSALTSKKNLPLLLIASFIIGFIITIAEPDVQVLAGQVGSVNPNIKSITLLIMIAVGIGFFVSLGLLRTVLQIPIKILYVGFYVIVFILAFIAPQEYFAISFDASGATTGPMTVPFIMALGMGVAAVKSNKNSDSKADNFGLTGLASIGPIFAVLIMGLVMSGKSATEVVSATEIVEETMVSVGTLERLKGLFALIPHTILEVAKALLPLVGLLVVFLIFLFRLTLRQIIKICVGLIYAFLGLILFLTGINGGFIPAGTVIGETLASSGSLWLLVVLGIAFGAIVVCAEPAVWVLTQQVEEISGGAIKRKVLLVALSSGVCIAVGLAMIRVIFGFHIAYILVPAFVIALTLTFFCPKMFTAIAFDSGGVASGPMTSSFILSYTLGAATVLGGNPLTDGFGVIALVASAPLITIQILGLIYAKKGKEK
ncbi:MAG: DUF1538 domain-containing protein [Treponemataceae bacterium]|nr:DUF1538 domain-containing protein [Treponemataceae bacterium]